MRPGRAVVPALAFAAVALAACARDEPAAPGLYSLTGHVVLTGHLVNHLGQPAGTRVVGDADGVTVELLYGSAVVARATTVDGAYQFSAIGPGAYVVRSRLIAGVEDQTLPLTVTAGNLVAGDTLRLAPRGDLFPWPNPLAAIGTTVYFELPDTQHVEVRVLDLSGQTLRVLLDAELPLGLNGISWDGRDAGGLLAPPGQYWVTLVTPGEDPRAQLLFTKASVPQ
jgi:hypothetical protein